MAKVQLLIKLQNENITMLLPYRAQRVEVTDVTCQLKKVLKSCLTIWSTQKLKNDYTEEWFNSSPETTPHNISKPKPHNLMSFTCST